MNALCCQHRSVPDLNRLYQACGAQRYAVRLPGCYPSTPPLRCWPPSFRGVMSFCRPATYHGIEPPPFLPSLDKRAGIEPALSLLVAGGDPGFWHGPWPYLPGCAGEDHCRRQVPLYVLSHHHCAFTNKKKSDPRRMFVGPTGIRSCYPRASTVLHARALSCWPQALTRPGLRAISRRLLGLPQPAMACPHSGASPDSG